MICKIGFGDGNIVLFSSRKIEWTSCTFKNLKNIFYLLERFNNVNILGMREDFRILCLIDVSIIAIHATVGVNWRQVFQAIHSLQTTGL